MDVLGHWPRTIYVCGDPECSFDVDPGDPCCPACAETRVERVEVVRADAYRVAVEDRARLCAAMIRCAEKLESSGNEEPCAVASHLRDIAHAHGGGS